MDILFTGATGVIGRRTVPDLIEAGHQVTAVARATEDHTWLKGVGARPIAVDLFDRSAVLSAVAGSDAVVHMATAIPPQDQMPKRAAWATNDRLRTVATSNLVDAAMEHDVAAFVQQSITFVYADGDDRWLDEDSPVAPFWDVLDSALEAERHVARFADRGGRGVVLRLSSLYGPGGASEAYVASVADRKLPIIGSGENYVSHLHINDAATAIVAALTAPSGVYNVSDDTPVTRRDELDALASILGARPPRRLPRWMARAAIGSAAELLAVSQRVSNRRFKATTGWAPEFGSVVDGWYDAVADVTPSERQLRD